MIVDIGRLSLAKRSPLWGVDQVHGAGLVLDELLALTTDESACGKIQALIEEVRQFDKQRGAKPEFLKQENDAFARLHDSLAPQSDSRNEFLIDPARGLAANLSRLFKGAGG